MSSPLFVKTPTFDAVIIAGDDGETEIVAAVAEPTLIEEIIYASYGSDWFAGRAIIWVRKSGTSYPVLVENIAAATADGVSRRFPVNITLPVGCSMRLQHNVQLDPAGNANIGFAAIGGIVR